METSRNCPSHPEPYPQNRGHHVPQWKELQGIHFDHFVGWLHAGIASFSERLVCSLLNSGLEIIPVSPIWRSDVSLCVSLSSPVSHSLAGGSLKLLSANLMHKCHVAFFDWMQYYWLSMECFHFVLWDTFNCYYNLWFSSKSVIHFELISSQKRWTNLISKHKIEQTHWFFSLVFISQLQQQQQQHPDSVWQMHDGYRCGVGGWGGRKKSTGRVTNGRQPDCQLTVAVLHGGLANENERKRGEKEEEGRTARRTERGQGYFSTPKSSNMWICKGSGSNTDFYLVAWFLLKISSILLTTQPVFTPSAAKTAAGSVD